MHYLIMTYSVRINNEYLDSLEEWKQMHHWLVTYSGWDVQEQCKYTYEILFSVYSKAVKYALRCEDDGEDEVSITQVSVSDMKRFCSEYQA